MDEPDSEASPSKSGKSSTKKRGKGGIPKIPGKPRPMTGQVHQAENRGSHAFKNLSFRATNSRIIPDQARAQSAMRGDSRPGLKDEPIHISSNNFFPSSHPSNPSNY